MNEFEVIAKYLRPLTKGAPGALALSDDAAVLAIGKGDELVLTKDAMVAGVHFFADDPLDLVAKKLLRVNVSDLAAKGASPVGYLLACCWPKPTTEEEIAAFARGLAEDQAVYGLTLLGGDTTSTPGPLTLSLTAIGSLPRGHMIHRSGAKPGDLVFVTGTIGDAGLGLKLRKGENLGATKEESEYLLSRYRLPTPRPAFGIAARNFILASIDVSDGLVADAGHIAEISAVALRLEVEKLPFSPAARAWLARGGDAAFLATCGDDYEICFTASRQSMPALDKAAQISKTQITEIGTVVEGKGAHLIGSNGQEITLPKTGFTHF